MEAARLQAAESECRRLLASQPRVPSEARKAAQLPVEKRVKLLRERLAKGGDVARSVLRDLCPDAIWPESSALR
jgi:hypothetical protein